MEVSPQICPFSVCLYGCAVWYVFVCMSGKVCVHMCEHVCGGQVITSGIFLYCSPDYFEKGSLGIWSSLTHLEWLDCEPGEPIGTFPPEPAS